MRRRKFASVTGTSGDMLEVLLATDYSTSGASGLRAGVGEDAAGEHHEWLLQGDASSARQKWKNIAIVSRNNIAIHGVRSVFRGLYPLRVQIFSDACAMRESILERKDFHPEIIIWIDSKTDFIPGMATLLIQISRRLPAIQQLVISECIPVELAILPRGVRVVSLTTPISELTAIMKNCLIPRECAGKLFPRHFMTPGQWRIIRLLMKGLSAKEVAAQISISPKTVWGREEEVMRRLNLQGHAQKAWFYRSIAELLIAMPGLGRLS